MDSYVKLTRRYKDYTLHTINHKNDNFLPYLRSQSMFARSVGGTSCVVAAAVRLRTAQHKLTQPATMQKLRFPRVRPHKALQSPIASATDRICLVTGPASGR